MGTSASRTEAPKAVETSQVVLDERIRDKWRAQAAHVRQHAFDRCKKSDDYPRDESFSEIVEKEDVPYARDFIAHFEEFVEDNKEDMYGVLGEEYADQVDFERGQVARLGDAYMLSLSFVCQRPLAAATISQGKSLSLQSVWSGFMGKFRGPELPSIRHVIGFGQRRESWTIKPDLGDEGIDPQLTREGRLQGETARVA
ncbi:hypothetical protein DIPPA_00385 [Diplonema papillatum]|nr:hypothetical protein DIPPA_00385 [Diplonema papillatum]